MGEEKRRGGESLRAILKWKQSLCYICSVLVLIYLFIIMYKTWQWVLTNDMWCEIDWWVASVRMIPLIGVSGWFGFIIIIHVKLLIISCWMLFFAIMQRNMIWPYYCGQSLHLFSLVLIFWVPESWIHLIKDLRSSRSVWPFEFNSIDTMVRKGLWLNWSTFYTFVEESGEQVYD